MSYHIVDSAQNRGLVTKLDIPKNINSNIPLSSPSVSIIKNNPKSVIGVGEKYGETQKLHFKAGGPYNPFKM